MAISNADTARQLERVAAEQTALRRVATLVARGAPSREVVDAVGTEVGKLLHANTNVVGRYDGDGLLTAIATWSDSPGGVPVGTRSVLGGRNALTIVAETGEPARMDDYDDASGEAAEIARLHGWTSSIAAPIIVDGRLWGAMLVAKVRPDPFPQGAEERLAAFTDLVATALANAQAQDDLRRYGEEQAALQRVATLVAQGTSPAEIFSGVSREVETLLGAGPAAVVKFDHDPPGMIVVGLGDNIRSSAIGARSELVEEYASTGVYRTGRSARVEAAEGELLDGPVHAAARDAASGDPLCFMSAVASPLVVEGKLWGAMSVSAPGRLPPDTEARLERFTDIIVTAIANAESKYELAASRRRIVSAGDEARRRIERDLHDGIQQRLIELTFRARALSRKAPDTVMPAAVELAEGLAAVSDELREISRGIHPTILSEAGLGPALRALARRSTVPIEVEVTIDGRLAKEVEVAAYYVASEALANVAKHSEANLVELVAEQDGGVLTVRVRDDGVGGADPSRGSGILGLKDRVEALGGSVSISSAAGEGTVLSVSLPRLTGATAPC